jgi:hypothetical protein
MKNTMKTAIVYKDWTGYWVAEADDIKEKICGYQNNELDAYKAANRKGYLVR